MRPFGQEAMTEVLRDEGLLGHGWQLVAGHLIMGMSPALKVGLHGMVLYGMV